MVASKAREFVCIVLQLLVRHLFHHAHLPQSVVAFARSSFPPHANLQRCCPFQMDPWSVPHNWWWAADSADRGRMMSSQDVCHWILSYVAVDPHEEVPGQKWGMFPRALHILGPWHVKKAVKRKARALKLPEDVFDVGIEKIIQLTRAEATIVKVKAEDAHQMWVLWLA